MSMKPCRERETRVINKQLNKQLRAKCESQRASLLFDKEALISCSKTANVAKEQKCNSTVRVSDAWRLSKAQPRLAAVLRSEPWFEIWALKCEMGASG